MKKLLISLLLSLALLLSLGAAVPGEARLDYVTDGAGLLTEAEVQDLQSRAARISEQYGFGVYIVVVDDYTKYANGSIENFAETVFDSYGLGYGSTGDGVLLAMSMKDRDYDIYAHGDFGNYAFTDYGKDQLANSFLDDFRRNDWAGGFRDFIKTSGDMLEKARNGQPVDTWIPDQAETGPRMTLGKLLVSLGVGCLTGGATVGGMKRQMKTAIRQSGAANYVAQGGVSLAPGDENFINAGAHPQGLDHGVAALDDAVGGAVGLLLALGAAVTKRPVLLSVVHGWLLPSVCQAGIPCDNPSTIQYNTLAPGQKAPK